MGLFSVLIATVAAGIFFYDRHILLGSISVVIALAEFWTYGVMHNYMTAAARQMGVEAPDFHFNRLSPEQQRVAMERVPNSVTMGNLLLSILGVGFLIVAILLTAF